MTARRRGRARDGARNAAVGCQDSATDRERGGHDGEGKEEVMGGNEKRSRKGQEWGLGGRVEGMADNWEMEKQCWGKGSRRRQQVRCGGSARAC